MISLDTVQTLAPARGHAGEVSQNIVAASFARWGGMLLAGVDTWIERHQYRRGLLELNDHLLKDIGISRADALQEGSKRFWHP